MPIIKKNGVEIYYEEAGSGFPLLVLPGGVKMLLWPDWKIMPSIRWQNFQINTV